MKYQRVIFGICTLLCLAIFAPLQALSTPLQRYRAKSTQSEPAKISQGLANWCLSIIPYMLDEEQFLQFVEGFKTAKFTTSDATVDAYSIGIFYLSNFCSLGRTNPNQLHFPEEIPDYLREIWEFAVSANAEIIEDIDSQQHGFLLGRFFYDHFFKDTKLPLEPFLDEIASYEKNTTENFSWENHSSLKKWVTARYVENKDLRMKNLQLMENYEDTFWLEKNKTLITNNFFLEKNYANDEYGLHNPITSTCVFLTPLIVYAENSEDHFPSRIFSYIQRPFSETSFMKTDGNRLQEKQAVHIVFLQDDNLDLQLISPRYPLTMSFIVAETL